MRLENGELSKQDTRPLSFGQPESPSVALGTLAVKPPGKTTTEGWPGRARTIVTVNHVVQSTRTRTEGFLTSWAGQRGRNGKGRAAPTMRSGHAPAQSTGDCVVREQVSEGLWAHIESGTGPSHVRQIPISSDFPEAPYSEVIGSRSSMVGEELFMVFRGANALSNESSRSAVIGCKWQTAWIFQTACFTHTGSVHVIASCKRGIQAKREDAKTKKRASVDKGSGHEENTAKLKIKARASGQTTPIIRKTTTRIKMFGRLIAPSSTCCCCLGNKTHAITLQLHFCLK